MSTQDRPLAIRKHRLVPETIDDASVTQWRCLDCDREYRCASEVLDESCSATGD